MPKKKNKEPGSDEQYRLLFESNPHPMWIYDLETLSFLAVNDAAVHQYGYSRDEFLSMTIKDMRPPEDIPALLENVSNVTNGLDDAGIWIHRKKDGSIIEWKIISHTTIFEGRRAEVVLANDVTGSRRMEEALRVSEEKYRSIFENSIEGIYQTRLGGSVISMNPAFARMLGYDSPQEFMDNVKNAREIYTQPERMDDLIRLMKANGIIKDFEFKARKKNGTDVWISLNARALCDSNNKLIGLQGIALDITERKLVERALLQSEEKYRTLIENIQDGVFIIQDGKIRFANEAFTKIGGYDVEDIIGKDFSEFVAPEDMEKVVYRYSKRQEGENVPRDYEFSVIHKDGSRRLVNINVGLINYRGKQASMGTLKDITEKQRAEKKLRLFRNLINQSNDAIFVSDPETGIILDANEKACSNLGYTLEELLNLKIYDFETTIHDNFSWKEHITEVEKRRYLILEGRHRRKDGTIFPVEINVNIINLGKNSYMVAVVRNITERKQAEDELKIKAQLLDIATDSIFVHDLGGNFIYVNEAAYRSHGYSKDELMKLKVGDIIVPEHKKLFNERINYVLEKGDSVYESANLRKDMSIIPIEVHSSVFESGGEKLILAVTRDITERKQAEKMQKEKVKAELYGFIISALPVFASSIPSSVMNTMVKNFADRFEKNINPRFEEEKKRLHYNQTGETTGIDVINEDIDVFTVWLANLFSNFGIRTDITFEKTAMGGTKSQIGLQNCPWLSEAKGNPVFCFICRTIVIRSFTWTKLKGNAEQKASIANGSQTCLFEINV